MFVVRPHLVAVLFSVHLLPTCFTYTLLTYLAFLHTCPRPQPLIALIKRQWGGGSLGTDKINLNSIPPITGNIPLPLEARLRPYPAHHLPHKVECCSRTLLQSGKLPSSDWFGGRQFSCGQGWGRWGGDGGFSLSPISSPAVWPGFEEVMDGHKGLQTPALNHCLCCCHLSFLLVLNLDKYRSPKTAGCSATRASQIIAFFFFFSDWWFVTTLCQASLLALFFQ